MQSITARFPLPAFEFAFAGFNWPRYVATLPRGSRTGRLARKRNPVTGPYYHAPKPVKDRHPGKGFYLDSDGAPGLRWQWCDAVAGQIKHTGWCCDDYQDQTIRGVVFQLPKGRGWFAGWSMGEGMASTLAGEIYADEISAAYAADYLAEKAAEEEREYQAAYGGDA